MTWVYIALALYALFWLATLPLRTWYAYLVVMALDHGDEMPYEFTGLWTLWCAEDWPKAKAYILTKALVLDAVLNATWAVVVCCDLTWRDGLLTQRMERYLHDGPAGRLGAWRLHVAQHVCKHLLNPYARGGCHCHG